MGTPRQDTEEAIQTFVAKLRPRLLAVLEGREGGEGFAVIEGAIEVRKGKASICSVNVKDVFRLDV